MVSQCMTEATQRKITAQITDENDVGISSADLTTVTMTLYDLLTNDIINSRNAQDILNDNNVTIDTSGNLVWLVQVGDNAIVSTTLAPGEFETHILLIEWTYNAGASAGRQQHELVIENLGRPA